MPFAELPPSFKIFYIEENPEASSTVLLLHGLGATSESWRLQFPVLAQKGYHVIAPDVPGFGQSPCPKDFKITIPAVTKIIAQFLELHGKGKNHVIGISMGGTLALQLVLDYPSLVDRLILVNTFANLEMRSLRMLPYYMLRFIMVHTLGLGAQARLVVKKLFPRPDQELLRQELTRQILQSDPRVYRATMRALTGFDVSHRLGDIERPTMIVSGAEDTTVPLERQSQLAKGIRFAKHVVIPGAGHAVIVEAPQEFNAHMVNFLS